MLNIEEYLKVRKKEVDEYIERYLPESGEGPSILRKAMRYSLLAGGKRLRPILVLCTYEMFGKNDKSEIMPVAIAQEFIHTFTLIHDDLPALDNDDLRRGKPTNHKVFGEAMAILAGDALFIESFNLLLKSTLPPDKLVTIMKIISKEIGINGVIGGQVMDVQTEKKADCNEDIVRYIHEKKTASFLRACIEIGAVAAGSDSHTFEKLSKVGTLMGLAFQIVDDILDETSTPEELGKTPGKDRQSGKCTWVKVHGLENAKKEAQKLVDNAINILDTVDNSYILKEIARFIIERTY